MGNSGDSVSGLQRTSIQVLKILKMSLVQLLFFGLHYSNQSDLRCLSGIELRLFVNIIPF